MRIQVAEVVLPPEGLTKGAVEKDMRKYEFMFIVDPNLPDEEIDHVIAQSESLITDRGGSVLETERMGRRKLAYEVDRRTEGFYVLIKADADGSIVSEVERRFRVLDSVLRYITVRVDESEKKLAKLRAIRERKGPRRSDSPAEASPEQTAAN
jgi:small subunit ribosomal protein S6